MRYYLAKLILFVIACPILAVSQEASKLLTTKNAIEHAKNKIENSNQANDLLKLKKLNIDISANWRIRLQLQNQNGGGAVDGGGGNFNLKNNTILDLVNNKHDQPIGPDYIIDVVEQVYKSRLDEIEQDLPLFRNWVYSALREKIDWTLTNDELNQNFCKNFDIKNNSNTIIACQTWGRVKINKSWFLTTTQKNRSDLLFHELVRYHSIRVAQIYRLNQEQQDSITADLVRSINGEKISTESVYQLMQRHNFLNIDSELFIMRKVMINKAIEALTTTKLTIDKINLEFDKVTSCNQVDTLILKEQIVLHRQLGAHFKQLVISLEELSLSDEELLIDTLNQAKKFDYQKIKTNVRLCQ